MWFGIKKILSAFLLPLPLGLFFLLIGLFLLWTREAKWVRNLSFVLGFSIIFIFSWRPCGSFLINSLQSQYQPLQTVPNTVTRIVVLGGGTGANKAYPANVTLAASSLSRLVEGIRILKMITPHHPNAELILSGGRVFQSVAVAGKMRNTAVILGVNPANIILENGSQDTRQEALFLEKTLKKNPFVLVTSAYHMPRAMRLFQKLGFNPIAAPTQFIRCGNNPFTRYVPNTTSLTCSDIAIHEYLGMCYEKLKGHI